MKLLLVVADRQLGLRERAVRFRMRAFVRLLVIVLVGVPVCLGQAEAGLQAMLFGMSQQFMASWQQHDVAKLAITMAPEFVYLGPQGVTSREVVVRDLSTHCDLKSYKLGEPKLLRTGEDSAVLIYTLHQDLTCFGHPDAPDVLNSDTFVRRGGKWLFAMTTSTPLAGR